MSDETLAPIDDQLAIIATERDRIAGELHDDSVQAMTAVSLQLQRLLARCDDADDRMLLIETREMADAAIERLRHMLFVLHPSSLEDDGLAATLEVYLESYVAVEDIAHQVSSEQHGDLPLGVAALAFRLARESISNAVRHASPSRIDVAISATEQSLVLEVSDDGCGFDIDGRKLKSGHLGLRHSRALAEAALGSFDIVSDPRGGTKVTITLPLPESA